MSLRLRLVAVALLVTLAALAVADVIVYRVMRGHLVERLDRSLREAQLPLGRGTDRGPAPAAVFVQLRAADGTIERSVPAPLPDGTAASPRLPAAIDAPVGDIGGTGAAAFFDAPAVEPDGPDFRVKAVEGTDGRQLIIAAPLTEVQSTLATLRRAELAVTGVASLLAVVATWLLVGLGLRPLRRVERAATAIAGGDLDRRAGLAGATTEIGRVGASFDTMVDRLTGALDERARTEEHLRRFVADAAHELRTPIAAVSAYAELIERGAADHPDDLERAVRGITAESARLGALVEDLLMLARLDEAVEHAGPVELVGIAAEAVAAARAIGPAWPVTLHAAMPVDTTGHASQLRRAIDNLLANVRTHTPPGTACTVTVDVADGQARVTVADAGPGLPPELAERAFERFWRADPARTRASGGAGLGLSIVAAIAAGHRGTAALRATPGGGTTVVLTLPMA